MASIQEQESWLRQLAPWARWVSEQTGLKAEAVLAKWSLETGFGTSSLWKNYFNPAGMTYTGAGDFRKYGSIEEGMRDYVKFVHYPRYASALSASDAASQIDAFQRGGWCPESDYTSKVVSLIPKAQLALANTDPDIKPGLGDYLGKMVPGGAVLGMFPSIPGSVPDVVEKLTPNLLDKGEIIRWVLLVLVFLVVVFGFFKMLPVSVPVTKVMKGVG